MTRFFYVCLLRLHPRPFRQRFAEEMLWIFDEAAGNWSRAPLLADALISLWRQWVLRPKSMKPATTGAAVQSLDGVPFFYTCESFMPRRSALIQGGILSVAVFSALSFAISHGGAHLKLPVLLIGSHRPHANLLEARTPAVSSTELDSEVQVRSESAAAESWFAPLYFQVMPVLGALDADHNLVISAAEIANAPAALSKLDKNHDGQLSPEECGLGGIEGAGAGKQGAARPILDPQFVQRARSAFMRVNPVLAALDADHDGEISAIEMQHAPAALKTLDRNGHGKLTTAEVLPDPVAIVVSLFMSDLDKDRDGKISNDERSSAGAQGFRELLDAADRDGFITPENLAKEIRRRAVLHGIVTHEQMLSAYRLGTFGPAVPGERRPPKDSN